jgi:hypothetical protein
MLFQNKGVPTTDLRFSQQVVLYLMLFHIVLTSFPRSGSLRYSQRLQSNLTWLAAAADQGRQGVSFFILFSLIFSTGSSLSSFLWWAGHASTTRLLFLVTSAYTCFLSLFVLFLDGICVMLSYQSANLASEFYSSFFFCLLFLFRRRRPSTRTI